MNQSNDVINKANIKFVATYWRPNAFSVKKGLVAIGIKKNINVWRRVAVITIVVSILSASAAIYFALQKSQQNQSLQQIEKTIERKHPLEKSKRIEFYDTPLSVVVPKIEEIYNIKIENLPDEEYRLSLSYEGNASDLVNTINELLGIELIISK